MKTLNVYTLGTGAPLSPDRATTGLLLEADGLPPLLIDTCSGGEIVRRLAALDKAIDDHHHVILTHRHGDHVGGVPSLALAVQPLNFYGPEDTLGVARQLIQLTFGELQDRVSERTIYHPVRAGETYDITGYSVSFYETEHRVQTYAVRVEHGGKIFAFSSDSVPCDAVIQCARDADLFLCDAVCSSHDDPVRVEMLKALAHPTAGDAAEMAKSAGAKRLGLVHVSRFGTPTKMLAEAEEIFAGEVTVPDDNQLYEL